MPLYALYGSKILYALIWFKKSYMSFFFILIWLKKNPPLVVLNIYKKSIFTFRWF